MRTNDDLRLVAECSEITDLSLEQTKISDAGSAHLRGLPKLQWLNLYRCEIGDEGLKHLKTIDRLQHLPLGETKVTGVGLAHLQDMRQLVYLGLRGNSMQQPAPENSMSN